MSKQIVSHTGSILKGLIIFIIGIKIAEFLFPFLWSILKNTMILFHANAFTKNFWYALIVSFSPKQDILPLALSFILLLVISWGLGRVSLSKFFSMISKKRGLFCVRIKRHSLLFRDPSFPWTYAIGVVMNEYKRSGLVYYNILFPNLAGMITLFGVPAEDTERVDVTPEDLLAASASLGMMRLDKSEGNEDGGDA